MLVFGALYYQTYSKPPKDGKVKGNGKAEDETAVKAAAVDEQTPLKAFSENVAQPDKV